MFFWGEQTEDKKVCDNAHLYKNEWSFHLLRGPKTSQERGFNSRFTFGLSSERLPTLRREFMAVLISQKYLPLVK